MVSRWLITVSHQKSPPSSLCDTLVSLRFSRINIPLTRLHQLLLISHSVRVCCVNALLRDCTQNKQVFADLAGYFTFMHIIISYSAGMVRASMSFDVSSVTAPVPLLPAPVGQ